MSRELKNWGTDNAVIYENKRFKLFFFNIGLKGNIKTIFMNSKGILY